MATISQHISTLRHLIKNYSDDTFYSDEFLYKLLKDSRSFLLDQQAKKFNKFSDFSEQQICMPLVMDTFHDCSCLPVDTDCKVLKSKYELPSVIMRRNGYMMKVRTLNGIEISYISDMSLYKKMKYSKTKGNKLFWTISNDYLIILGTTTLGVVLIEAVFEDPEDLSDITFCTDEETEGCYDVGKDDFPIKASLNTPMYSQCLQVLAVPMGVTDDLTNDNISQGGLSVPSPRRNYSKDD